MDKQKAAAEIIAHAVPLAAFDGWNHKTLAQAAIDAGYSNTDAIRVFPGGAIDAVNFFMRQADEAMAAAMQEYHLDTMKIRDRIATAVRLRLEAHDDAREALRKALALQALPFNLHHALKNLYRTVDAIWYAIGDNSNDFNFYTKRITLAAVYSSTLLYWLEDKTPGHEASWAFLARRIEDVMTFEKAKSRLKGWLAHKLPA